MFKKLSILKNLDIIIAGLSFVALVGITFGGVVMRYIFGAPFTWEEEIQISLFIWITFFGGIAAFRTYSHVQISMFYDHLPLSLKRIVACIIYFVVVFTLFYLCLKSLSMVIMFIDTKKYTPVLSIPCSYIYGIIPVCCILMIINYTFSSLKVLKDLFLLKNKKNGGAN